MATTPELVSAHPVLDKASGLHSARPLTEADRQRVLLERHAELAVSAQAQADKIHEFC